MNKFFTRTTNVSGPATVKAGKDYVASKVHELPFDKLREIYEECLLNKKYKSEDIVATFNTATNGDYGVVYENSLQFLNVLTRVLGSIIPDPSYNFALTIKNLQPVEAYGLTWSVNQLREMITFAYQIPFSAMADIVQTRSKMYNAATPLFLLGQKLYNQIPYNKWDPDPKSLPYATCKMLFDVSEFFGRYPEFKQVANLGTDDDVSILRIAAVTGTNGMRYPFTSFRANNLNKDFMDKYGLFQDGSPETEQENYCFYNDLPKTIRMMLLQLWIFNASCRNEHMICDLNDLSKQPEPLDSVKSTISRELPE
jgi:hypothetical protein